MLKYYFRRYYHALLLSVVSYKVTEFRLYTIRYTVRYLQKVYHGLVTLVPYKICTKLYRGRVILHRGRPVRHQVELPPGTTNDFPSYTFFFPIELDLLLHSPWFYHKHIFLVQYAIYFWVETIKKSCYKYDKNSFFSFFFEHSIKNVKLKRKRLNRFHFNLY